MIATFKTNYFAFIMSGSVRDFQSAFEAFRASLAYGTTLEELQTVMDDVKSDAELLCVALASASLAPEGGDA